MNTKGEFYTTGVWASAVAKAAVKVLLTGEAVSQIEVLIPSGKRVLLPINVQLFKNYSVAKAKKISPEADDVTHNAILVAKAFRYPNGIIIEGGEGIGTVTKRGLKLSIGEKAINPVPRYFILKNVGEIIEQLGFVGGLKIFAGSGKG